MIDFLLNYGWIFIIVGIVIALSMLLRRVVPPNEIHIVVRKSRTDIYCANPEYFLKPKRDPETGLIVPHNTDDIEAVQVKSVYYYFPSFLPFIGMYVRRLPLEMLEIKVPNFVAFDMKRARFECDIVAFCAIIDGKTAAMRIPGTGDMEELEKQVQQVLWATMRDSTTKMIVRDIINNRKEIINMIKDPLKEALDEWGLGLKDIEIIEFKDAPQGKVISNISSIREQEIETEARQKNADQKKQARLAEAQAEEIAKIREVERDEAIQKRDQDRIQKVAVQQRLARQKELDVVQVEKVKNQEIEKEKAEVFAEQERAVAKIDAEKRREVESVIKQQKLLEGQGDRQRDQEQALGKAAYTREQGIAEADALKAKLLGEAIGKEKLQEALNKFTDAAIRAMTAIREIEKDEAVYSKLAESMAYADAKLFMGGGKTGKDGFEFGKAMEGLLTGSGPTGLATINRLGQPNDLGFQDKNWIKLAVALQQHPELKKQIREAMDESKQETIVEQEYTEKEQDKIADDLKKATRGLSELFSDGDDE